MLRIVKLCLLIAVVGAVPAAASTDEEVHQTVRFLAEEQIRQLTGCQDNEPGVIAAAKRGGSTISGCADVKSYCKHGQYGPIVQSYCPKTCDECKDIVKEKPTSPPPPKGGKVLPKKSSGWQCPAKWTTGDTGAGVPDAKAYTAVHNVLRCVHGTPAVQWDGDVYTSAKAWAGKMGNSMSHSHTGPDRPKDTGENLAGVFGLSAHPGVDASHNWYSEIFEPCNLKASCFQSFSAGHMTAMIWKDVEKIAYALTTPDNSDMKKMYAIGRYKAKAGGLPPNFNNKYVDYVLKPVNTYADCYKTVMACPTFSDVKDIEGCDGNPKATWDSATSSLKWFQNYKKDCADKYTAVKFDVSLPDLMQSHMVYLPFALVASLALLAGVKTLISVRGGRARRVSGEVHELSTHSLAPEGLDSALE